MPGRGKYAVAGLLLVSAVIYLMVSRTADSARFYMTIEELQAMGSAAQGRRVTISGAVLGDSIVYESSLPRVSFTIAQMPADPAEVEALGGLEVAARAAVGDPGRARIDVVYDDVKPDMLRHEAQAIVRGRLGEDGLFHADQVLLKCPSRYVEEAAKESSTLPGTRPAGGAA